VREGRLAGWLTPAAFHPGQQPRPRLLAGQADKVDVDLGTQQPRQLAVLDPHLQQTVAAVGIVQERPGPLLDAIRRGQVGGRDQGQGPVGLLEGVAHARHEVIARLEVPRLHDHLVAGLL
jgi:hypothetical protein